MRSSGPTTIWWCRPARCMAGTPRDQRLDVRPRPGRQGLAFQLLQQRADRECDREALALTAESAGRIPRHRPAVVERRIGDRRARGDRAARARRRQPTACALPAAGHSRQQSEGRQRAHLAGLAPGQWLRPARLRSAGAQPSLPDGPIGMYYDDLDDVPLRRSRRQAVRLRLAPADRGRSATVSPTQSAPRSTRARRRNSRCG